MKENSKVIRETSNGNTQVRLYRVFTDLLADFFQTENKGERWERKKKYCFFVSNTVVHEIVFFFRIQSFK